MKRIAVLALCVVGTCARTALPADSAAAHPTPNIEFVHEYMLELGELERLRVRMDEMLREPDTDPMMQMIGYSRRVQIAMRSYIGRLNSMRLEAPYETLIANVVALHNSKYRVHGRIVEISTAMLAGAQPGIDLDAMAAEAPRLRAALDEVDAVFGTMSRLAFTTLVSGAPDANGQMTRLRITAAERDGLLETLKQEFGSSLDDKGLSSLAGAAAVLRGYLRKDFTPSDGQGDSAELP